ncbi:nucleoside monophosphate kinase [Candidatus Berkelbacteria bacterium]|nr:nucleoside monophosphate kinase [Candidatus Berkelbacteria bacterium]
MAPLITPVLLVLGPQGSGKGTQVSLLAKKTGWPVVTMGELFRSEAATGTERGQEIGALIDHGHLVPGTLWEPVLKDYLKAQQFSGGLILDAVVRSADQFGPFDRMRAELGIDEPFVLFIDVPEPVSIDRLLLRGRVDDTREAIQRRLTWSREQAGPVVDHYRSRDRVIDINGNQPVADVHREVIDKLHARGILELA